MHLQNFLQLFRFVNGGNAPPNTKNKWFDHHFQPTNMLYTMSKLSFIQFLLISKLNHHFLLIYTKTKKITQKTYQNIKNLEFFNLILDLDEVSDVDRKTFERA